jgi:hypothetical protein
MIHRRKFLAGIAATTLATWAGGARAETISRIEAGENLVPDKPAVSPNYWCTWAAQNYMYGHHFAKLDIKILEGDSGGRLAHDSMSEDVLFGKNGWATDFFPKIRNDLYLLIDDGWEAGGTASFELDEKKFPSFNGTADQRLRKLNDAVRKAGWRSSALWCRNTPGGDADDRLEEISQAAGIPYWKIDIGDPTFNLIRLRNQTQIPLTLEHVHGESAVNGNWRKDGRFGAQPWGSRRQSILQNTDIYRTYDVTSILSLPTTLDRIAEMLKGAQNHSEVHALLNVEDEVYVAAALGCTMGVMRHPMQGLRPGVDADLFFNGPRLAKKRMDEVVRALRWQRIAPPFSPGIGSVRISDKVLTDSWEFERGQTWQDDIIGMKVSQSAPASIARNLALPEIETHGESPFVLATGFPNGAVAIAAQERTKVGNGWYMPTCDVKLQVSDKPGPFGIFGDFDRLTLSFDQPIRKKRMLAQDLAGDRSIDITESVMVREGNISIPGSLIRRIGLQNATPGDISAPGMIMAIREGN